MFQRGWFWFDNDSMQFADGIVNEARQYGVVRTGRLGQAMAEIDREPRPWAGVVTHFRGQVRELEQLRCLAPTIPVLALSAGVDTQLVRALRARGIDHAVLPDNAAGKAFVQRAFTASFLPNAHVAAVVQELAERFELTAREVQIVAYYLADDPRELMRKRLGVTENTFKSQVRGLLRKSGNPTMDALAKNVMRSALLREGQQHRAFTSAPRLELVVC